ncbi:hypothetical protein GCM10022211_20240 [Sphingomonas humi]|uniref:Lipoprotein n=2 Tax=Sphingomonas humi TaxID=335630 RepID=A0ABP7S5K9_9SPHN
MPRHVGRMISVALTSLSIAACGMLTGSRTVAFRIDVYAGEKVLGSSVMSVTARETPSLLESAAQLSIRLKGEALALDENGRRGLLFMTLKPGGPVSSALLAGPAVFAMADCVGCGGHQQFWNAMGDVKSAWRDPSGDIPRKDWPLIVRFRDSSDPASVSIVDPAALSITAVRVTRTKLPVSDGLRDFLPWLTDQGFRLVSITGVKYAADITPAQELVHTDFRQGFKD